MQSGTIKHWNSDKGYGFIDVDNQSEDVFFHIKSVRLSQPISEGQRVYFNSKRNDKNQLRATEVTSNELSILESSLSNSVHRNSDNAQQKKNRNHNSKNTHRSPNKKSAFSTLLSLITIIAVAVYFFADLKSSLFADGVQPTISQIASESASTSHAKDITGDVQIDQTLTLIQQGGPFPYPNKDGTTFYNREGKLPAQSQGYYREYTVPTPGVSHRGARRIVTGGYPPTIYYLTLDHYDSFQTLQVK